MDCPDCGQEFESEHGLKTHHSMVHDGRLAGVTKTCVECGDEFTVPPSQSHYERCSMECRKERVEIECEECGDTFTVRPSSDDRQYCSRQCAGKARRERVTVSCAYCGSEFERWPCLADGVRFCSDDCRGDYVAENGPWYSPFVEDPPEGEDHPNWSERVTLTCRQCGDEFDVKPSAAENRAHCSHECKAQWMSENLTGEAHPRWAGGGQLYYGENWIEQRAARLAKDNYECQGCGASASDVDRPLEVHHVDPIRNYDKPEDANTMSNLITLCRPCHARWEGIPVRPEQVNS